MWQELEYELVDERSYLDPEWGVEGEADYSVIAPRDDRFQIRARRRRPSTLQFPFNSICFLEVQDAAGARLGFGSGTLIAPQVVLTAKHVLMDVSPPCAAARHIGPRFPRIRVTPGADFSAATERQRRPATPSSQVANSRRFRVDPNLDYGVIILPRPFRRPNRFMVLQPRSSARTATLLTIAGYPCDKPEGTMWGHSDRIAVTGVNATNLFYTIDTCAGHSGSPIWLLGDRGIRLLLGVHTAGPARCDNDPRPGSVRCLPTGAPVTPVSGQNCGVRITCNVINNIVGWCREFGVREPRIDRAVHRRRCRTGGASAPPTTRPTLRRGSRGAAVRDLQRRLNRWLTRTPGVGLALLAVDGIFGRRTQSAVLAFQRAMRILVDGIVGPQTWGRLLAVT